MSGRGSWTALVKDERTIRLILGDGELDIEIRYERTPSLEAVCRDIPFVQEVYEEGYYEVRTKRINIKIARLRGAKKWMMQARGKVRYEIELSPEEALLMALLARDTSSPSGCAGDLFPLIVLFEREFLNPRVDPEVALAIFKDRLERAIVKGRYASGHIEPREDGFYLSIDDPGKDLRLKLIKLKGEEICGLKGEVKLKDREALKLLMGMKPIEDMELDEHIQDSIYRHLVRAVLAPFANRLKITGNYAVVKNYGLVWAVDLSDGDLLVNGESICTIYPFFEDGYGLIKLPGLGEVELTEEMARILCNIFYALMPEKIKDPDICKQILSKASPLGDKADCLPAPCVFLRLWLKARRWLRLPRFLRRLLRA